MLGQSSAPADSIRPPARTGYLTPAETPDVVSIVPAAPAVGDPRYTADMAIFKATRALEGSPRWTIAQLDDNVSTAGIFRAFSCALGFTATPENAPLLTKLVTRANVDAGRAANILKQLYQHKRPYQVVEGAICLTPAGKASLERSPDYPSGHTAASWEVGLILAALAPDAGTAILSRARAFGESRVVCGVHNQSAVEAGWMSSSAIFAAQTGSAAFRADFDTARAELAELRKNPTVDRQACALEAGTLEKSPY